MKRTLLITLDVGDASTEDYCWECPFRAYNSEKKHDLCICPEWDTPIRIFQGIRHDKCKEIEVVIEKV